MNSSKKVQTHNVNTQANNPNQTHFAHQLKPKPTMQLPLTDGHSIHALTLLAMVFAPILLATATPTPTPMETHATSSGGQMAIAGPSAKSATTDRPQAAGTKPWSLEDFNRFYMSTPEDQGLSSTGP